MEYLVGFELEPSNRKRISTAHLITACGQVKVRLEYLDRISAIMCIVGYSLYEKRHGARFD